ncbi:helix-turn-helix transcriptional regulator [Cecembia calidifontis]|nr:WYL domain-containing protein [Cecembia calidifontis]
MPKNRFADVRYRELDKCLRDTSRYYTIYDLAEKCSKAIFKIDEIERPRISIKQIRNDLAFMESDAGFEAEIISEKIPGSKKHYFRYANPDFSISNKPLNDKDAENLKNALYILQRFKGLPQSEWIDEFSARIETLHGLNPTHSEVIRFEHEEYFAGSEWINPLYKAIDQKQPLKVLYRPFGQAEEEHLISPYLLKQFNRRWFVLCKTSVNQFLTNLALDRIVQIDPGSHSFIPYPGEKASEFFEDIIGVTNYSHESVQTIFLEVEKSLLPYIESKPLHGSQKPAKPTTDENWFSIQIRVKTNYEFYALLLSHGSRIRVVSPEKVKNKIKTIIMDMVANY